MVVVGVQRKNKVGIMTPVRTCKACFKISLTCTFVYLAFKSHSE